MKRPLSRAVSLLTPHTSQVTCVLNEEVSPKVYDREVNIAVARGDTHVVFCVAHSTVMVVSDEIEAALQSGSVGIGQLFRTYNILPQFRLLDAGRTSAGFCVRTS